jgi:hypothetical protein
LIFSGEHFSLTVLFQELPKLTVNKVEKIFSLPLQTFSERLSAHIIRVFTVINALHGSYFLFSYETMVRLLVESEHELQDTHRGFDQSPISSLLVLQAIFSTVPTLVGSFVICPVNEARFCFCGIRMIVIRSNLSLLDNFLLFGSFSFSF